MKRRRDELPEIEVVRPSCVMVIEAGGRIFYAHFEDGPAAGALRERLNSAGLTVRMEDRGGAKTGSLPWALLPEDGADSIVLTGDGALSLVGSGGEVPLARIGNATRETLHGALGEGDVSVTFSLEWGE